MPHIWIRLRNNPIEEDDTVLAQYGPERYRRRPDGQPCRLVKNVDEKTVESIREELGDRAEEFTVLDDDR
jgi:hypothetical protein